MHSQEFGDVEAVEFPGLLECSKDRQQTFICRVYLIIAVQLVLTIIGSVATVILTEPLSYFLVSIHVGLPFYLAICIAAIIALYLLYYRWSSYLLLGLLTSALTFLVGLTCVIATGKAIIQSAELTSTMFINLTLYTFWAASKGYDFDFLGPFLFGAIVVTMGLAAVQILYPLGKTFVMIYGCFGITAFCCYIVCITDSLIIKSYSYNNYIWAAVSLYVDFINLFLLFLSVIKVIDC